MYRKTALTNGLRIVSHDMKDRDSMSIGLWVGTGGRFEEDHLKGVAHFLEHIIFKGSQKYTNLEIKEKIEGVGGTLNAFTAEEFTCCYAKIPSQHIRKTFDILADMVFYPLISKNDVEKERTVILEEIKMYSDLPQYLVLDLLDQMMWPDHPLGKNLIGTKQTVSHMSGQNLREFHKRHYCANNVVIASCGRVQHQEFVNLAHKSLSQIPSGEKINFNQAISSQKEPQVKFYRKEIEQTHLALGMFGLREDHKDKYALILLHVILGGNMSSRLFDEVREKRGLAYSISSTIKTLQDTGMFLIRAGVDNPKAIEAMDIVLKELEKIKRNGVSRDEFTRAKDYYFGQVLLGLEDTMDHMLWIGESVMARNHMKTIKDIIRDIDRVKREDIKRVARDIFKEKHFNLAMVGPSTDQIERGLRHLLGVSS